MNFQKHIDTIRDSPFLYLKGSPAKILYPDKFRSITLCILVDLPIHINTKSMGLPIVHFKGSQVEFSKL